MEINHKILNDYRFLLSMQPVRNRWLHFFYACLIVFSALYLMQMMKIIFNISLYLLITLFPHVLSSREFSPYRPGLPFTLQKDNTISAFLFLPLDFEKDGTDEYLLIARHEDNRLKYSMRCYRANTSFPKFQTNFSHGIIYAFPYPLWDKEQNLTILLGVTENDTAYLDLFDRNGIQLDRLALAHGIDRNSNGLWDGFIEPARDADLNEDGYPDIICISKTSYDLQPRGVCAYDLKNKRKLWEFATGTVVREIEVSDLTRDGKPEIIFGSAAMCNGSVANETDDYHSYLIILNNIGNLLVLKEMGENYSNCQVRIADVNGDDQPDLVSLLDSKNKREGAPGRLTIWKGAATTKIRDIPGDFSVALIEAADMNRDGKDELVIAGGLKNMLLIYNGELELLAQQFLDFKPNYFLIDDLNADGKLEIILPGIEQTMVYNHKLQPIAATTFTGRPSVVNQDFGMPKKLALNNMAAQKTALLDLRRNVTHYVIHTAWLIAGIVIGVIIMTLSLVVVRLFYFKRGLYSVKSIFEAFPFAIILMDKKGKPIFYTEKATAYLAEHQLNLNKQNTNTIFIDEIQGTINSCFTVLRKKTARHSSPVRFNLTLMNGHQIEISCYKLARITYFFSGFFICIQDMSLQNDSKRALAWAAMSQKLAHEIKNPLYTIMLTLQRLQLAYQEDKAPNLARYDKYTNSALEEVERLQRIADGFMKFTKLKQPEFTIIPADALIRQIETRTREWLPKLVKFKVETEKKLPHLNIDINLMQQLFFNLLDNAVKAISGKGRLYLKVYLFQVIDTEEKTRKHEMIVFEISDTGCGIPGETINQLFEPYFSRREGGTGLGLTICKKIVEDHDGKISIQSKINTGTTVRVELPVLEH